MKSLKQKWADFLPVSLSILGVVLAAYLIIHLLVKPDTRTLQQILDDKLRDCVKYTAPIDVHACFKDLQNVQ